MALTDPGDSAQQVGGRGGAEDVEGGLDVNMDVWLIIVHQPCGFPQLYIGITKQNTRHPVVR
jgi:hypothetical protein